MLNFEVYLWVCFKRLGSRIISAWTALIIIRTVTATHLSSEVHNFTFCHSDCWAQPHLDPRYPCRFLAWSDHLHSFYFLVSDLATTFFFFCILQSSIVSRRVRKLRKLTTSFVMLVCLCVGKNLAPTEHLFFKFAIWGFFESLSRKFKFCYTLEKKTGTLHEDLHTVMILTRWIILKMRNISDKICRRNENIYFISNNCSPKIVLFMR